MPPGIEGTVVDVRIFSRKGTEKDERAKSIEEEDIQRFQRDLEEEVRIVKEEKFKKLRTLIAGHVVAEDVKDSRTKEVICPKGKKLTEKHIERIKDDHLMRLKLEDSALREKIESLNTEVNHYIRYLGSRCDEMIERVKKGDELPPGVNKVVKSYIAMKRKIQIGDKMAGRHGNKGVVATVMPEEDMPYLPDGTPVDIVLNPLGVPSRMNVGQVLETHLGWAAKALGINVATPVFEGAKEGEIKDLLKKAKLPVTGQITLHDGKSGEQFDKPVTVGSMYMMKLHHLVDDKIHARSIGPYSLVTQQPLGGKAQFGGQGLEKWRSGHLRPMVHRIPYRSF